MKQITLHNTTASFNNDLSTPMSAMLKLNQHQRFLLESVDQGEKIGRYSLLGLDPMITVKGHDNHASLSIDNQLSIIDGNPLDALNSIYKSIQQKHVGTPPIKNGFFGYFTWDIMTAIETITINKKTDILFEFQIPKYLLIFDHAKQTLHITISSLTKIDPQKEIQAILAELQAPLSVSKMISSPKNLDWDMVSSNMTKDAYESAVLKVKDYIKEGDIFQGVISQKFHVDKHKSPLEVYRTLRHLNPSPYMFYFDYGDFQIIGSSPEILVKSTEGTATVRPIAGTRKRTFTNENKLIKDLTSDQKEIAEHVMLVDLGRNDLGRVCDTNSIQVSDFMSIEKYSHVLHMVTNVDGKLKKDMTPIDLFKATFPCGTVSGAPKIRAIEIINELEPDPRHIYSGSVGYFNMDGDMDLCISIRTIVADHTGYTVQAGAGIVNDSIPEHEYNETKSKAQGILMACFNGDDK